MYKKIYFITNQEDKDTLNKIYEQIEEKYGIEVSVFSIDKIFNDVEIKEDILFLLYLDDKSIKIFFQNHLNKNIFIGILANENCLIRTKNYGISNDLNEALEDAFNSELLSKIDLLKCNDFIALNRVSIGDMHGMNRINYNKNTKIGKIKIFFSNLKNIAFKSYTLKHQKITISKQQLQELQFLSIRLI